MANYKSQFTGEQIDEAIGKVLNAPNIYNYYGTVIIEKAESVLGLRKLIGDKIFSHPQELEIDGVEYVITESVDGVEYVIEIEKILVAVPEMGETGRLCAMSGYVLQITPEREDMMPEDGLIPIGMRFDTVSEGNGVAEWINGTGIINVTKCDNETAKAWLLANTEGVSV